MPITKLDNIELFYQQSGSGPDLLLISGLGTDHTMWETSRFEEHFRVTVFDNRGSGQSSVPEGPYSVEMLAADAADLLRELGIERASVVGHSMGGHIAQVLGALHPELIHRLVVACSEQSFSIISRLATSQQMALFKHEVPAEILVRNYLPVLFDFPFLEDSERVEEYVTSVLKHPHPMPRKGYILQTEALQRFDTRHLLSRITAPTLVIGAKNDLLTPYKNSEYLAAHIPGAKLKAMEACGHAAFLEKPDEFYQLCLEHLLS